MCTDLMHLFKIGVVNIWLNKMFLLQGLSKKRVTDIVNDFYSAHYLNTLCLSQNT